MRRRSLPEGWYPKTRRDIEKTLEEWRGSQPDVASDSIAAIVPHAGWGYSGKLAFDSIVRLSQDAETLVIVGGHLPKGAGLYYAPEDEYYTPLGSIKADSELLNGIKQSMQGHGPVSIDRYNDNTVEIHLPIVKYMFPGSHCVWLRSDPSANSKKLGVVIGEIAARLNRSVRVIGSTDLTHYGPAYGFTPAGRGVEGLEWAESLSDPRIIKAYTSLDYDGALLASEEDRSSCSVGGAIAAMAFAGNHGITEGVVVRYLNSCHVRASDSFVGYVGIVFPSMSNQK